MSTQQALNPSERPGPSSQRSLIIVTFEVGMLMRYPTEEDLRMSLPQTPPASMALMPSFSFFILHFPFPLSVLLPLKSCHKFAEASHSSHLPVCFLSIFFQHVCVSPSLSICLFLYSSLCIPILLPLSPHFPCFSAPPSNQTSEPTINAISFW